MIQPRIAAGAVALALAWSVVIHASEDKPLARRVDAFVDTALVKVGVVPGLSVAVVRDGKVVLLRGYGLRDVEADLPVTPDSRFYIASSTKSFVAMAASILMSEGRLDAGAPVSLYLPELELPAPLSADSVTIEQLLTHTHGIGNRDVQMYLAFRDSLSLEDFETALLERSEPIPTSFIYTNLGYNVMGYVLESITGMSWKQTVARLVTQPLGMKGTTTSITRAEHGDLAWPYQGKGDTFERLDMKTDGMMHAAGGIMLTANDAARWLLANLDGGRIDGHQALPADAVARTHTAHVECDADFYGFHRFAYGYGWYLSRYDGDLLVHHFGGYDGYHAHISFMPEHNVGVAVLMNTNAYGASALPHMIATYVYDVLLGKSGVEAAYREHLTTLATEVTAKKRVQDGLDRASEMGDSTTAEEITGLLDETLSGGLTAGILDEGAINRIGYDFLSQHRLAAAIATFRFNVDRFPDSANAYDSLGEALEASGQMADATRAYETALAKTTDEDLIRVFREHVARVAEKQGAASQ